MEKRFSRDQAVSHNDDIEWADRSEYWRTYEIPRRGGPKKYRYREPLIVCGHGIRLRVDHGTLLIRNGFTHYPQESEEIRFFPGDPNLPDRIIISDGSGGISLDALNWMAEQQIDFVQLDWRGNPVMVGGNSRYSARPELVDAQRAAQHGRRQVEIARWLVEAKVLASLTTLAEVIPKSENREIAISRVRKWISELRNSRRSFSLPRLRGTEGAAALAYFRGWHGLPLKWSGLSRRPIPASWHEVGPRKMGWLKRGTNARHPINAMLNYGYGILISQVCKQVVAAGLDPSIGVTHSDDRNSIPLVYDLMEPLRPVVDRNILKFALSSTFTPEDFTINQQGGCRLNPQMVKAVVRQLSSVNTSAVIPGFRQRCQKAILARNRPS